MGKMVLYDQDFIHELYEEIAALKKHASAQAEVIAMMHQKMADLYEKFRDED